MRPLLAPEASGCCGTVSGITLTGASYLDRLGPVGGRNPLAVNGGVRDYRHST